MEGVSLKSSKLPSDICTLDGTLSSTSGVDSCESGIIMEGDGVRKYDMAGLPEMPRNCESVFWPRLL